MDHVITRRALLKTTAMGAVAAAGFGHGITRAWAAGEIVAAAYPGSFEESYRRVLLPAFAKSSGGDAILVPMLATEQVAKITASPNNPPLDVALLDEGPAAQAAERGLFEPFPADKSAVHGELLDPFKSTQWGPTVTVQLVGIAYNPKKIKTPPKSWKDLWNPEYKGRVGITTMESSLGTAFAVEVAKLHGGSEANIQPGFDAIKELMPNVGAVAPSPGALAALFQQGQVDIAPQYFNSVELLTSKGVDIAFVSPDTGLVLIRTSMHIVKNSKEPDLALKYIDAAMEAGTQEKLQESPYYLVPTNKNAKFSEAVSKAVGANSESLLKGTIPDWPEINKHRTEWIKAFSVLVRK
jgi:putative spermidine/putrescine transport system substrate-binding protein